MMTVGRGGYPGGKPGMSQGQYRIEVFLYAVLSSPMVLSFECACLLHTSETPLVLTRGSPDLEMSRVQVWGLLVYLPSTFAHLTHLLMTNQRGS